MPPKRQRKKNRTPKAIVESKAPLVGSFAPTLQLAPAPLDPLQCLAMLKQGKHPRKIGLMPDSDGFELITSSKEKGESKETKSELGLGLVLLKNMVRTMFKADHPYRTRLGFYSAMATSASGGVNVAVGINSLTSAAEWSSIDAIFDEVFVHSLTLTFQPYNKAGGVGSTSTSNGYAAHMVNTTAVTNPVYVTCGLIMVALYDGASSYTTASAMLDNPSHKIAHSSAQFKYVWRSNVRFDPRGPLISTSGTGWSGWTSVANAANLSGQIQIRAANDTVLGDLTHAWNMGTLAAVWDVSFRARA